MGEPQTNSGLIMGLIITAGILGVVAIGFFVWTIYVYQKNKKYIKKEEDKIGYSASLFFTALGGKSNVKSLEFKISYIHFVLENPEKIIIEYIEKLPKFQKIVRNGSEIDIYFSEAFDIYNTLINNSN